MMNRNISRNSNQRNTTKPRQTSIINIQCTSQKKAICIHAVQLPPRAAANSTVRNTIPTRLSTQKRDSHKPKLRKSPHPLKEKKNRPASHLQSDLKYFQSIILSPTYQTLNSQYTALKKSFEEQALKLKISIMESNSKIVQGKTALKDLVSLKESLALEADRINGELNDLKLENYELKCELIHLRGYADQDFYDSLQEEVTISDMDYEDLLELEERIGEVNLGCNQEAIHKMPTQIYSKNNNQQEKCCICCVEFDNGDEIFETQCMHTHHRECLQKWLAIKRFCPLCRAQIKLQ